MMIMRMTLKHYLLFLVLFHVNQAGAQAFVDQREGFVILLEEIENLEALIIQVQQSPAMPARYSVNYQALKEDLRILKTGVQQVTENPISLDGSPRSDQAPMQGDYLR